MSKEGLDQFRNFISAEDQQLFDPLFIAHYLLLPVNTIVKNTLLPWLMRKYVPPGSNPRTFKTGDQKFLVKKIKSLIYLRYTVLVNLLQIVKKYGKNPQYNFEDDEKLKKIKSGSFGDQLNADTIKGRLAMNTFTTIWLMSLPEKFKEWYETAMAPGSLDLVCTPIMSHWDTPGFPEFESDSFTKLICNKNSGSFDFLPQTWKLMPAFEAFFKQTEMWCTKSIEWECNQSHRINSEKKRKKEKKHHQLLLITKKKKMKKKKPKWTMTGKKIQRMSTQLR